MYSYIIGIVTQKDANKITLENNGIGYEINVSNQTLDAITFENEPVRIYTYLNVKEDEMSLYGFLSNEEKDMFLKLLTVGGIGPKMALGILSEITITGLMNAIASEDLKLRGPGDLFGIRQSGLMDFGLGDIYQDAAILQKANEAAEWLLKNNPEYVQQIPDYEGTSSVII